MKLHTLFFGLCALSAATPVMADPLYPANNLAYCSSVMLPSGICKIEIRLCDGTKMNHEYADTEEGCTAQRIRYCGNVYGANGSLCPANPMDPIIGGYSSY